MRDRKIKIKLFKHNELAYQKLENFLETEQMGSIDHATGTGKSFIALKYLYNHRNKKNTIFISNILYLYSAKRCSYV